MFKESYFLKKHKSSVTANLSWRKPIPTGLVGKEANLKTVADVSRSATEVASLHLKLPTSQWIIWSPISSPSNPLFHSFLGLPPPSPLDCDWWLRLPYPAHCCVSTQKHSCWHIRGTKCVSQISAFPILPAMSTGTQPAARIPSPTP